MSDLSELSEVDPTKLREPSSTMAVVDKVLRLLTPLRDKKVDRLLDVGCGFGNLGRFVGKFLGAKAIHGIDNDPAALEVAQSNGLLVHELNVEVARFPFSNSYFDFVVSGGLLEHLTFFDKPLQETNRVLRDGGLCLFSMPNLGSWLNRFLLPLGYQPRDVEISRMISTGHHSAYSRTPFGHVHSATTRAFQELMQVHGFRQWQLEGWSPPVLNPPPLFRILDAIMSKRASLARRFLYLGEKVTQCQLKDLNEALLSN